MNRESHTFTPLALLGFALLLPACTPKVGPIRDTRDTADSDSEPETDLCDDHPGEILCVDATAVHCDAAGDIASSETCVGPGFVCIPSEGCGSCTPDLAVAFAQDALEENPGIHLVIEDPALVGADFSVRRLALRPLTLSQNPNITTGRLTLSGEADFISVHREDGAPLALPATFDVSELPLTLLLRGVARGTATLELAFSSDTQTCYLGTDLIEVHVGSGSEIAGRPRPVMPWFEFVDAFNDNESVWAGLDPTRVGERVGLPYDLCVVEHRSPEAWALDPSYSDITGACRTASLSAGTLASNEEVALANPLPSGDDIALGYDVIVDFGQNGVLDAGDLFDGPLSERAGFYAVRDLSLPGPLDVRSVEYSVSRWLTQRIYFPSDITSLGELPLVVISHGNGHDYTWYDYLGEHLASHGYVVMSHTNNTGPGIVTAAATTISNTDQFLGDLPLIERGLLEDHVDPHAIIWIGHSRGGEGVVYAYDQLVDGTVTAPTYFGPEDVVLIASIAPTVFYSVDSSFPHEVPYFLIAGTADGDVTGGPDCPQCCFFRIALAAQGPTNTAYVQGADHNDFNCCGFEDASGPSLIGREEAQVVSKSYFLALLAARVEGDPAAMEYLTRLYDGFRPAGIDDATILTLTDRPALADRAGVIEDYQDGSALDASSEGELVSYDVSDPYEGRACDFDARLSWTTADLMNGMTDATCASTLDTSRVITLGWSAATSYYEIEVPEPLRDLTAFTWLSFRGCQQSRAPQIVSLAAPLDFSVALVDSAGVASVLPFGDLGQFPSPYARTGLGSGSGWANEWSTVRLRLSDFEGGAAGFDLSDVGAIRFLFGEPYGSAQGRIGLDDIEVIP